MGFFSRKNPGVTESEWKKDRTGVRSVFGYSSSARKKADEVERLITSHLDADYGSHKQKIMTSDELDQSLDALERDKRITSDQARKIRHTLERDMRD